MICVVNLSGDGTTLSVELSSNEINDFANRSFTTNTQMRRKITGGHEKKLTATEKSVLPKKKHIEKIIKRHCETNKSFTHNLKFNRYG